MIVYCDTSFLLSLFREEDANHNEANELASRFDGEEFVLCEAHQIEFPAATRRRFIGQPVHCYRMKHAG